MNIEPLPTKLYQRLLKAGITKLALRFSGGSDEGLLDIEFNDGERHSALEGEVDNWVWEVYDYSGAGDGNDYGDDIVYDLPTMKATHGEWTMQRHDEEEDESTFELVDDGSEGDDTPELTEAAIVDITLLRAKIATETDPEQLLKLIDELSAIIKNA